MYGRILRIIVLSFILIKKRLKSISQKNIQPHQNPIVFRWNFETFDQTLFFLFMSLYVALEALEKMEHITQ